MPSPEYSPYYRFTGPQRLDKAIHTLEGLLEGISIDRRVTDEELVPFLRWVDEHRQFSHRHPFSEIIPRLQSVLSDHQLDAEEVADVLWLCEKLRTENRFYDVATSDIQRLQGIVAGISIDGKISKEELEGLSDWLLGHASLKTCWPYDEVDAIITAVLSDGKISPAEHDALMAFFREFGSIESGHTLSLPETNDGQLIFGICAACPDVVISGKTFCATGELHRYTRNKFAELIESRDGKFSKSVTKSLDYLVIGADGNPCWTYACYGRKVEQAMTYRKQGCRIIVVHENDFWDAIQ